MSISKIEWTKKPIHLWSDLNEVEQSAQQQLQNVANLPWVFHHVAVMPDVHYGKGATVGSVIAMKDAVSPACVGVDIGCGMGALKTELKASDLPENLDALRSMIEAEIPVGFNAHDSSPVKNWMGLKLKNKYKELFNEFRTLTDAVKDLDGKADKQLGTLGGGNHFIEVCLDTGACCKHCDSTGYVEGDIPCNHCYGDPAEEPSVWLMLHSGSRNIGKCLAEYHIGIAQKLAHNQKLPDRDLAVFLAGTPEMKAYRNDLMWAQRYAFLNRMVMFEILKANVNQFFGATVAWAEPILCHHNYVSEETHFGESVVVTRKGAISARKDEMGIIPGSMGTKSYIVKGLGNEESFHSASHGAGRVMSRGQAKRTFTLEDLAEQTKGVNCRKDGGVLDEIPGAYKPIEKVMDNQKDLVEIVAELKQVMCIKG